MVKWEVDHRRSLGAAANKAETDLGGFRMLEIGL